MKLIELFSEQVSKLWNEWEVRVVILISLLLQIILIIFGSQRKYRTRIWIKIVVWSTYMSADWVATVALGNLAKIQANYDKNSSKTKTHNIALQTFWAPFLLLHLGGPDTITAYSLEDNELWSRHFLGLIVEVGVAFYVYFRSFNNAAITFVSIPIFVSGIIKYGERTYVLRSASNKQFKKDLLSTNPIVENAMRIAMGIKEEDYFEMVLMEEPRELSYEKSLGRKKFGNPVEEAYFLFKRLEYLFANLILPFNDRIECYDIIQKQKYKEAFKLVEIELGLMYDVLYTKANIIRTRTGCLLRVISLFSSVSALIVFSVLVDIHIDLHVYPLTDIFITLLLLVGAVFLEIYGLIVFLFSDWTKIWLEKQRRTPKSNPFGKIWSIKQPKLPNINCLDNSASTKNRWINYFYDSALSKKRWSASVAQYNLIGNCLAEIQDTFIGVQKCLHISEWLEEYRFVTWKDVDFDLQEMIFEQLKEKADDMKENYTMKTCKELLAQRGNHALGKYNKLDEFSSSTIDIEFDHSILVWHIATDICYHDDDKPARSKNVEKTRRISKYLSDYMLYLLIMCPSMLPKGIGEIRYKDTCAQVKQFLKTKHMEGYDQIQVCKELVKISKRNITQSILSDGCELAIKLKQESSTMCCECKWKMISEVWIEMLTYAASHCGWKEHGQQLWKGGELLTHVCVLMAHLGLSDQYNEMEHFYLI